RLLHPLPARPRRRRAAARRRLPPVPGLARTAGADRSEGNRRAAPAARPRGHPRRGGLHQRTGSMALIASPLWRRPAFLAGLLLRAALILLVVPSIQTAWFVPFVHGFAHAPALDPWSQFLANGGDPLAFPYGPVMLAAYLPGAVLALILEWLSGIAIDGLG